MAHPAPIEAQSATADSHLIHPSPRGQRLAVLSLAALGVVYGDIGTNPLYAIRECFSSAHAIAPTHDNAIGDVRADPG